VNKSRILDATGLTLACGVAVAGAVRAWQKGMANEPEWAYHKAAASTIFEGGLSVHNPGYLPGFSALMRPFFLLSEGVGLALFIALALVASWFLFRLVWRECAQLAPEMRRTPGAWHWVWFAAPLYFAIQNNQVMTQMMLFVVVGFLLLRSGRWVWGASALSLSVAIKTFPITLGLYLLLKRRWREAITFGVLAGATTVLLGSLVYGPAESIDLHLAWPGKVGGQEPANLLRGEEPRFFDDNQSVAAWIVRAAPWIGSTTALVVRYAMFWGSLLITAYAYLRSRTSSKKARGDLHWDDLALWIAWIVFASPFGRYYYAVMLLPAWVRLTHPGGPRPEGSLAPRHVIAHALPLLAWGARSDGVYPIVCALTFLLILRHVWTRGEVEGPQLDAS